MSRPLPRYKQIEADLLAQIADGRYKKGSCIPPEQELAKQYGVSRVTMRKALEGLVAQGLLVRTPGAGTFVSRLPQAGKLPGVVSFADEMRAQGLTPRTEVTEFRLEPADGDTARRLGVEPGAPVYFFRRSQYADEVLFMLETSRMSAQEYPGISLPGPAKRQVPLFSAGAGPPGGVQPAHRHAHPGRRGHRQSLWHPGRHAAFAGREHHLSGRRPHPGLYRAGVQLAPLPAGVRAAVTGRRAGIQFARKRTGQLAVRQAGACGKGESPLRVRRPHFCHCRSRRISSARAMS